MKLFIFALFAYIKSFFTSDKEESETEMFLPLNLQFFAEPSDPAPADPPPATDPPAPTNPFATFPTKEELNKRLDRAKNEGQKALAKELGYDTIAAMQVALKKDKPAPKTGDEPVDVAKLIEESLKDERAKGYKRLLNAEVKVVANELGFADYGDAIALADLTEVKENDKGDLEGVEDALKALATKKPHLLKAKGSGNFGADIASKRKTEKENLESIKKLAQTRGAQATVANDPWKR